jgi:hypothetical protein
MAIQAVGTTPFILSTRPAKSGGPSDANAADTNVVIGKVTKVNPDGSVTTITTYADGHTETQTAPASAAAQPAADGAAARART